MVFTDKFDWYRSLAGAGITDTEFRVLVLLANYADGTTGKRARPSAMTLAKQAGRSDKTVRRALAVLVAKGWLLKIDRPGTSTEYELTTPTLDTQMSRVTDAHPGHSYVQGRSGTLDKSDGTLDTQMSRGSGHLDVQRSEQGSDPLRIRSTTDSDADREPATADDPWASEPTWRAEVIARGRAQEMEPATAGVFTDSPWD